MTADNFENFNIKMYKNNKIKINNTFLIKNYKK